MYSALSSDQCHICPILRSSSRILSIKWYCGLTFISIIQGVYCGSNSTVVTSLSGKLCDTGLNPAGSISSLKITAIPSWLVSNSTKPRSSRVSCQLPPSTTILFFHIWKFCKYKTLKLCYFCIFNRFYSFQWLLQHKDWFTIRSFAMFLIFINL